MGTVGNALIRDLDRAEIVRALDGFHAYELLALHCCLGAHNRLAGQAAVVLDEVFEERAAQSLERARQLAGRIAQLGGAVTADPGQIVALAPVDRFALPANCADVGAILGDTLEQVRAAIRAYGEFLPRLADRDVVTYHLIRKLLTDHIANEDEIETVLGA